MKYNPSNKQRLTIRVSRHTLSFSSVNTGDEGDSAIVFQPYVVRSGISMAANLREAFKESDLAVGAGHQARLVIDSRVLLVPVEMFEERTMQQMYAQAYPSDDAPAVLHNVLPDLNAVAVFGINRDLKLVVDDRFDDVQYIAAMTPVWRLMHHQSFSGQRNKLYGYFHDQQLDVFSFQQNRFKFSNQFETGRSRDAVYFLLYVWNQLAYDAAHDELHLVGNLPDAQWLTDELKKYVSSVLVHQPASDLNEAPATTVDGLPFDLMTLFTRGR